MPKYSVQWKYTSSLGGPFLAGDVVELDEVRAEAINRDSPGVLKPTPNPSLNGGGKKEKETVDAQTIRDRQVKAAETRGRGEQQAMTTENFAAVKPKEE